MISDHEPNIGIVCEPLIGRGCRALYYACRAWVKPGFRGYFPDFPKQLDHKVVVLFRSRQFGNCHPVSSCLISFKMSSGTQTSMTQEEIPEEVG